MKARRSLSSSSPARPCTSSSRPSRASRPPACFERRSSVALARIDAAQRVVDPRNDHVQLLAHLEVPHTHDGPSGGGERLVGGAVPLAVAGDLLVPVSAGSAR